MPRPRETARHRAQLRAAQGYVRRRYGDPDLSLAEVASATGVSRRQLQRVFRAEGGEEFRRYLLGVRMQQAVELLSRGKNTLSVRAAARLVGYRHASGLRQAFVRFYGYNPSEVQPPAAEYLGTTTFE